MTKTRSLLPAVLTVGLFLTGCESYRSPEPARPGPASAPAPAPSPASSEPWVDVRISSGERQVIEGYVVEAKPGKKGKKAKGLPPGLAKKAARGEPLPPGWQKKIARGEVMPPEVYAQCHPLPDDLVVRLPPPPRGTVTVVISGKIVRLWEATREILDVFEVPL